MLRKRRAHGNQALQKLEARRVHDQLVSIEWNVVEVKLTILAAACPAVISGNGISQFYRRADNCSA